MGKAAYVAYVSMVLSQRYSLENTVSFIFINHLKGELSRSQHTVPLFINPTQIILKPEKSGAFLDIVDIWHPLCIAQPELLVSVLLKCT